MLLRLRELRGSLRTFSGHGAFCGESLAEAEHQRGTLVRSLLVPWLATQLNCVWFWVAHDPAPKARFRAIPHVLMYHRAAGRILWAASPTRDRSRPTAQLAANDC